MEINDFWLDWSSLKRSNMQLTVQINWMSIQVAATFDWSKYWHVLWESSETKDLSRRENTQEDSEVLYRNILGDIFEIKG